MVQDGYLIRNEQADNSRLKIKTVTYSPSEKFKRMERSGILRLDHEAEGRRCFYRLFFLILICFPEDTINIVDDEELDELRSLVDSSRKHLTLDGYQSNTAFGETSTTLLYRPVEGIKIETLHQSGETCVVAGYEITLAGITVRRVLNTLDGGGLLLSLPFTPISIIHILPTNFLFTLTTDLPFGYHRFTYEEGKLAFNSLEDEGIIKPILNFQGETWYAVSINELSQLIKEIHRLHLTKLSLMCVKWAYLKKTSINEKRSLEFLYGKRKAEDIVNRCHQLRLSVQKKNENERKYTEYFNNVITLVKEEINELQQKYDSILSQNEIVQDLLQSLLYTLNEYENTL